MSGHGIATRALYLRVPQSLVDRLHARAANQTGWIPRGELGSTAIAALQIGLRALELGLTELDLRAPAPAAPARKRRAR